MNTRIPTLFLVGAFAAPAAFANHDEHDERDVVVEKQVFVVSDEDNHDLKVNINNNDISVIADGEKIPASRIKRAGDQLIILDEDGNKLRTIDLSFDVDGASNFNFRVGDDDHHDVQVFTANKGAAGHAHPRVMIGVTLGPIDDALAAHLDIDKSHVIMLRDVMKDHAAAKAGLKSFDILTGVNGKSPVTIELLQKEVAAASPGDEIKLRVLRQGKDRKFVIIAEERDDKGPAWLHKHGQPNKQGNVFRFKGPDGLKFEGRDGDINAFKFDMNFDFKDLEDLKDPQKLQQWIGRAREAGKHADSLKRLYRTNENEWEGIASKLRDNVIVELKAHMDGLDDDTRKQLDQASELLQKALKEAGANFTFDLNALGLDGLAEIEILEDDDNNVLFFHNDNAKGPKDASRLNQRNNASNPDLDRRLDRLEERFERLEKLLERLVEESD